MRLAESALVAFAVLLSAPAAAQEVITACLNPAGQIRLVSSADQCRPEERSVIWNVMGPQGPAGPTGPQGPSGTSTMVPSPFAVLDATGTIVGHIAGRAGEALVSIAGERFFANLHRNGFAFSGRFVYQLADCSDVPSTNLANPLAFAPAALVTATAAWVPDESAAPVTLVAPPGGALTLYSKLIDGSGSVGTCLPILSATITLWPLRPIGISGIVPPLRLPE